MSAPEKRWPPSAGPACCWVRDVCAPARWTVLCALAPCILPQTLTAPPLPPCLQRFTYYSRVLLLFCPSTLYPSTLCPYWLLWLLWLLYYTGFHPDQGTEPLLDLALALRAPFALVPCCVFPGTSLHLLLLLPPPLPLPLSRILTRTNHPPPHFAHGTLHCTAQASSRSASCAAAPFAATQTSAATCAPSTRACAAAPSPSGLGARQWARVALGPPRTQRWWSRAPLCSTCVAATTTRQH